MWFSFLASSSVFADRVVTSNPCALHYYYISIYNPSTTAQTVDVNFLASGGLTLSYYGSMSGHLGTDTNCVADTSCSQLSTYRDIPAGGALYFGYKINGGASASTNSRSAVVAKIKVVGDAGYLTGTSLCQYGSDLNYVPINGGRPF